MAGLEAPHSVSGPRSHSQPEKRSPGCCDCQVCLPIFTSPENQTIFNRVSFFLVFVSGVLL